MNAPLTTRPDRLRRLAGLAWRGPSESALREAAAGRLVLITGASSGIGAETALLLAGAGATVLAVARRKENLVDLAAAVEPVPAGSAAGRILPMPADLTDEAQVEQLIVDVLAHGVPDIVVSNAGRSIRRPLAESYDRLHDYTRTMAINYTGPVQLLLGILPAMRAHRSGHIINISTIGVDVPMPYWSAYAASKNAFETWFRIMSPEARSDGVRSTSIHFGLVHTAMSAPTEFFRNKPGMTAAEAASVVARAVVSRRRMIRPWWSHWGAVSTEFAPGISDFNLGLVYRATRLQERLSRRRRPAEPGPEE